MLKFLLLFFSLSLFAQEQKYLYSNLVLGERDFDQYFGPRDPTLKRGPIGKHDEFADNVFNGHYLEEFGQTNFFELLEFVGNDLPRQSACSNHYLSKNIPRFRYLFRLLTISYVFETLKELKKASYNLGFGNICSLEWEDTFQKCRAKGIEMANFIKRIKGNHLKDFSNTELVKMKNEERELWLKNFHSKSNSYKELDLAQSRILYFCQANNLDCSTIDFENLKFAFQLSCSEDQFMMLNICSNGDRLYGLSNVKDAPSLIKESNAFNSLDTEGHGDNCLKRYIRDLKFKEQSSPLLAVIFPKAKSLMLKEKRTYKQGSLFIYGSLQEFESKGLEGFLFSENEEDKELELSKKQKEIEEARKKIKVLPPPKPEEIPTLDGFLDLTNKLKSLSGIETEKVSPLKSKIAQAEIKRFMSDSPKEAVDMEEFKKEFIFTEKLNEEMKDRIYLYQKKATFLKLKDEAKLGQASQPFPLSFIKYLIDFNEGESLNNILDVFGKTLFVINDLEQPFKVIHIELKREPNRWQIFILRQDLENESRPKFKGN